jgi:hypothetical protein
MEVTRFSKAIISYCVINGMYIHVSHMKIRYNITKKGVLQPFDFRFCDWNTRLSPNS